MLCDSSSPTTGGFFVFLARSPRYVGGDRGPGYYPTAGQTPFKPMGSIPQVAAPKNKDTPQKSRKTDPRLPPKSKGIRRKKVHPAEKKKQTKQTNHPENERELAPCTQDFVEHQEVLNSVQFVLEGLQNL